MKQQQSDLPTGEIVLIGSSYDYVQSAVFITVILPSVRVEPVQRMKLKAIKLVAFCRVVGVNLDIFTLEGRTKAELQLKS